MGLGPQKKDSKTFGTTVYGLTHPKVQAVFLIHTYLLPMQQIILRIYVQPFFEVFMSLAFLPL